MIGRAWKRGGAVATDAGFPPRASRRAQLELLIGSKKRLIFALSALSIVAGLVEAALLAIFAQVAQAIAKGTHHAQLPVAGMNIHTSVERLIAVGLGLAVLRLALQVPLSTLPVRIAADVQARLRGRMFRSFSLAAWDVQSRDREGALQEVMTNQTSQATAGALQATNLISASIMFVVLLVSAFALSAAAAALVFFVATAMFGILTPMRALGSRRARELSAAQIRYAGSIAEANRLAEESQVFGTTRAQQQRVLGYVEACRRFFYRMQVITKLVPNVYQSLIYLILMIALWVLFISGSGHVASLGAVVLLLLRAAQQGQIVQSSYQSLQVSLPFIDRLKATERRYAESAPTDRGERLETIGTLAFHDVSFSYNAGQPVLSDVTFRVDSGEAIGVVGPSGAGKSTLVQILLHLRDASSGGYLVNNRPVSDFLRADWKRLVAYVPQEPRLLHASVLDNVRFFRDISDADVRRACELARIHEDIESWRDGYETIVGPRADAVSGGQQQRLCLARALAAHPQVLVLDEPTSALDPSSEALIQESLTALRANLTLFTVAHRMSTLDICDRVMVILDGRLVAFDTRQVLMEENEYYRAAWKIASGVNGNGNGNGNGHGAPAPVTRGAGPGRAPAPGDWRRRMRNWLDR